MPAPKGNQYAKGNRGGRRKGYEFESTQLKRMNKLLNRMLLLSEKILDGKSNFKDQIKYDTLQRTFLKIMDKLHANKEAKKEIDITTDGEKIGTPLIGINLADLDYEKLRRLIEKKDNIDKRMRDKS